MRKKWLSYNVKAELKLRARVLLTIGSFALLSLPGAEKDRTLINIPFRNI